MLKLSITEEAECVIPFELENEPAQLFLSILKVAALNRFQTRKE